MFFIKVLGTFLVYNTVQRQSGRMQSECVKPDPVRKVM